MCIVPRELEFRVLVILSLGFAGSGLYWGVSGCRSVNM